MFTPEKMEFVQILFPKKELLKVTSALVTEGGLQIIDPGETEDWAKKLDKPSVYGADEDVKDRSSAIKKVADELSLELNFEGIKAAEGEWKHLMAKFRRIEREVNSVIKQVREIDKTIEDKENLLKSAVSVTSPNQLNPEKESGTFINFNYIKIKEDVVFLLKESLAELPHALTSLFETKREVGFLLISLKSDYVRIKEILKSVDALEIPQQERERFLPEKAVIQIRKDIRALEQEKEKIMTELQGIKVKEADYLLSILYRSLEEQLRSDIVKRFRKTETMYLVTGWIPADRSMYIQQSVLSATRNRCVIKITPAENIDSVKQGRVDVPVEINNPGFFKPFELITKTFGIPAYHSIDPTPVVAFTFLFMFGLMFGDFGHGAVLAVIGGILAARTTNVSFRNAGLLMVYAGSSSMIFGLLFGSIFGVEHWIQPLWMRPMESISDLFRVAIYFGIGMISLAILFNIINGIRERDIVSVIFDKAGFLSGIIYWCGIAVAARAVSTKPVPDLPVIVPLLMLIAGVLIFLHEPVVQLARGKKKLFPEGVTTGVMGGIIEVLEISLGFLANTVSFIRIAAFGLAHAGLFMAIFSLSKSMNGVAGGTVSALIIIVGNIGIICLEGLVVSIQAVRLEFYEFFSRFFRESSQSYKPLKNEILS